MLTQHRQETTSKPDTFTTSFTKEKVHIAARRINWGFNALFDWTGAGDWLPQESIAWLCLCFDVSCFLTTVILSHGRLVGVMR
jgi:hypothetical protein